MRARIVLAATGAVALLLAAGSAIFVVAQRQMLVDSITSETVQQANEIADALDAATPPSDLATGAGEQWFVQIIDADGAVVASSTSIEGEQALTDLTTGTGQTEVVHASNLPLGEGDEFVVVARGVAAPDDVATVVVARSLELVADSTAVVVRLLLIGFPIILGLVALASYVVAGRALVPVETMRRHMSQIQSTAQLDARVPEPAGEDEISQLAHTMNGALARLESSVDRQRRFVADASHELRSPLATIRAAYEISDLHGGARGPDGDVLVELDRIDSLVSDLLLLTRLDDHGTALHLAEVDLEDLVLDAARRARLRSSLEVHVEAPPARVYGDRAALERAIRNLVDNAVRAANARIDLRVQLRPDRAAVELEVEDDGPGVPADDRQRIFERFVRLDDSRVRDSGGSGLGLAIVKEIVHAHRGTITVEDGAKGARFVLTLRTAPSFDVRDGS